MALVRGFHVGADTDGIRKQLDRYRHLTGEQFANEVFGGTGKALPSDVMVTKGGRAALSGWAVRLGDIDLHGEAVKSITVPSVIPLAVEHLVPCVVGHARTERVAEGLRVSLAFNPDAAGVQAKNLAESGFLSGLSVEGKIVGDREHMPYNRRAGVMQAHHRIGISVKSVSLTASPCSRRCTIDGVTTRFRGGTLDALRAAHADGFKSDAILDKLPADNLTGVMGKKSLLAWIAGADSLDEVIYKIVAEGAIQGKAIGDAWRARYLMLDGNV